MPKFRGTFEHELINVYSYEVEAATKEEALKKIHYDGFDYLKDNEPINSEGQDVKVCNDIKEVK